MNTNKNMLTRLSNSTVGRALRRIFGDECGQGMMEYVIIATVIAAAAALAFAYFGKSTVKEVDIAGRAMTGKQDDASREVANAQTQQQKDSKNAEANNDKFRDKK